ncbi:MAG: exodeoxyribonuclease VII large subunit [Clostridia bacterium]|nr:exodeoxyribonuclease VII large subunit [Clostridia bacterium]
MDISSLRERKGSSEFTVSELNGYVKSILDSDRVLGAVSVKGEISNFTAHSSGHMYFSLKDEGGQIKAVMFKTAAQKLKFLPENGMKVSVRGSVSVYTQGGSYQLYVNAMMPDGVGTLYMMYERLKAKLDAEGLFDVSRKKALPRFPSSIGVITSPTGAAVRDIINVVGRRYPTAKIYIYPALVQGEGAEADLIKALDYFDVSNLADVIIIGRGGGSIEDLWAFNSEALARRIFSHRVPIISAVGHETDFTICDFVADRRAPTPSAAAEIAVPDIKELVERVDTLRERSFGALVKASRNSRDRLERIKAESVLRDPSSVFMAKRQKVADRSREAADNIRDKIDSLKNALLLRSERANALNPLSVLMRGFSVVEKDGAAVRRVGDVKNGDSVTVRMSDGRVNAKIIKEV